MILWQSLHIEVYRDTHDQASTSGDGDQHQLLRGALFDQQGSAVPDAAATMLVYRFRLDCSRRAAGRRS